MANDPAHGEWHVDINESSVVEVYCDASDLAYCVVLKCNGVAVEDRSCLRAKNDKRHINVAELDAVIKALDLIVDWSVRRVACSLGVIAYILLYMRSLPSSSTVMYLVRLSYGCHAEVNFDTSLSLRMLSFH